MTDGEHDISNFPGVAVWNVMFLGRPRSSWWDWLTEPEWRHVCAFGYISGERDQWVIYDVADRVTRISVVDNWWFDRWVVTRPGKITAIVQMPAQDCGDVRVRLGLWCVTAIKHLVGLKSGALRPRALHRDLLRNGGKPVFEDWYGRKVESAPGRPGNESAPSAG